MIVFLANNIGGYDYRQDTYNPVDRYINNLKVALYSLWQVCASPVTVYLVDCDKQIGDDLAKIYPNAIIKHIEPTADDQIEKRNYKENPKRFIMMREKILAVKNTLADSNNELVLFLDCDIIVLGSLLYLFRLLWFSMVKRQGLESTLTVRCRLDKDDAHKFNTGVIGLTNTVKTRALVDNWYTEALKIDKLSCEQEGLFRAYNKMCDTIKLVSLPEMCNDWNYSDNLAIYHSKGKYRTRHKWLELYHAALAGAQRKVMK